MGQFPNGSNSSKMVQLQCLSIFASRSLNRFRGQTCVSAGSYHAVKDKMADPVLVEEKRQEKAVQKDHKKIFDEFSYEYVSKTNCTDLCDEDFDEIVEYLKGTKSKLPHSNSLGKKN